jgi:hypothetical protein
VVVDKKYFITGLTSKFRVSPIVISQLTKFVKRLKRSHLFIAYYQIDMYNLLLDYLLFNKVE